MYLTILTIFLVSVCQNVAFVFEPLVITVSARTKQHEAEHYNPQCPDPVQQQELNCKNRKRKFFMAFVPMSKDI